MPSVSVSGEQRANYDSRSPMPVTPGHGDDSCDPRRQHSSSVSSDLSETSGAPRVRRGSLSSSSIASTTSGKFNLEQMKKWPAGEAIKPKEFGPIPVQLAVRFLYIKDAETHVQTFDQHGVDKAEEKGDDDDDSPAKIIPAFTCRFSVHQRWPDPYYKLKGKAGKDDKITGYATHPKIGNRAENFPDEDMSIHGVLIRTDGCPRWTPEIKFFDTMEPPTQIRCEYSVDREKGEVMCYYEAKGTFFGTRSFLEDGKTQELVIRLGTQHRTNKMVFVPHPEPHTKGVRADFTIGEFDFEKKPWVVKHKTKDGGKVDGLSKDDEELVNISNLVAEAVREGHSSLADAKKGSEKFERLTEDDFERYKSFRYISVAESHAPGYHMACFKLTASVFKRQSWPTRQVKKAGRLMDKHGFLWMLALMLRSWLKALAPFLFGKAKGQIVSGIMKTASVAGIAWIFRNLALCEMAGVASLAKPMGVCKP